MGIVLFFTLCIPLIIHSKFGDSEFAINFMALSPLASMGMTFHGFMICNNYHSHYEFQHLFIKMGFFKAYLFYVFNLL